MKWTAAKNLRAVYKCRDTAESPEFCRCSIVEAGPPTHQITVPLMWLESDALPCGTHDLLHQHSGNNNAVAVFSFSLSPVSFTPKLHQQSQNLRTLKPTFSGCGNIPLVVSVTPIHFQTGLVSLLSHTTLCVPPLHLWGMCRGDQSDFLEKGGIVF